MLIKKNECSIFSDGYSVIYRPWEFSIFVLEIFVDASLRIYVDIYSQKTYLYQHTVQSNSRNFRFFLAILVSSVYIDLEIKFPNQNSSCFWNSPYCN